jgi:putative effector of murein hydrolase LrgA (UPF0299 family)
MERETFARLSWWEILLLQTGIWLAIWLANEYLATLLTLGVAGIVLAILVFALLAEWVERSRVPRRYFGLMAVSALAPLLAGGLYLAFNGGQLTWMQQ